tara:strand:- start:156 stop:398 length:243 start_codon:yes stop_codon:yes gene_type:complete
MSLMDNSLIQNKEADQDESEDEGEQEDEPGEVFVSCLADRIQNECPEHDIQAVHEKHYTGAGHITGKVPGAVFRGVSGIL